MSSFKKVFDAETGMQWLVRVVRMGESYGQFNDGKFAVLHDDSKCAIREPLVEFYDLRGNEEPFGAQFVSRYYISTLIKSYYQDGPRGLCLEDGVPSWSVSAMAMAEVVVWLSNGYSNCLTDIGVEQDLRIVSAQSLIGGLEGVVMPQSAQSFLACDDERLDLVLAALRWLQRSKEVGADLSELSDFASVGEVSVEDIDTLCEELNC